MTVQFDERAQVISLQTSYVFDIDFSNDGTLVAAAAASETGTAVVQVFELGSGTPVARFGTASPAAYGVAWAGNTGLYFLALDETRSARLWYTALSDDVPQHIAHYSVSENAHGLARTRTSGFVAVLSTAIEVWDMEQREVVRFVEGISDDYRVRACFGAEGIHLYAYGTVADHVVLTDLASRDELGHWPTPRPYGEQITVSSNGKSMVAVAYGSMGVFVYDLSTGERLLADKYNEQEYTRPFALAPDGSALIYYAKGFKAFSLPDGVYIRGPEPDTEGRVTVAASAWDAPVFAFGKGDSLIIGRLVEV